MDNRFKKQRAEQSAARQPTPSAGTSRAPTAYLAEGSAPADKGVRYESAFMALQQDSDADAQQPDLKPLSEASDLPKLTDIPGTASLSDPLTPVRYLGLCCGASVHLIKLLVHRGRFFADSTSVTRTLWPDRWPWPPSAS